MADQPGRARRIVGHTRPMESPEDAVTEPAEQEPVEVTDSAVRRKLRTRARTLLTVDETVERVGQTTHDLAAALADFNTSLDRFNESLDRFAHAADQLNKVAARLDAIVDKIDPLLSLVMSPLTMARRLTGPAKHPRDDG